MIKLLLCGHYIELEKFLVSNEASFEGKQKATIADDNVSVSAF